MSDHKLLFLDFESYYGGDYTLSKMDPPSYILDPRWETIGVACRVEGEATSQFIDGPDFPKYLAQFDPNRTTTVAFNALFDNCILAWRYGFVPARMVCTMRLAVALRGHMLPSHSLAKVGEFLGVGVKGTTIADARGKHRDELMRDIGLWRAYQAYACNDNDMSRDIFYKLMPEFPHAERRIMDRVLRTAVEPVFHVNTDMLRDHLADLKEQKAQMLIDAGAETTMDAPDDERAAALEAFARGLRSNNKFQAILEARGIDVEYKPSVTNPAVQVPAFAKTDDFMAGLLAHHDPEIQTLATARIGLRSTIEETRGARILNIATLNWPSYCRGNMPIPLKYAAAHTHRLGGDWAINMQNLPAGRGTNKSKLRKALVAPPGYKVVVADASQIECRVNGWFCGQEDLLEIFRQKGDPYSVLGSAIFGFKVDKNVHKMERFIGKSGVLGLGFGCGDDKFYNMVVRSARLMGMDVPKLLEVWTPSLATKSVQTYRGINSQIKSMWGVLQTCIETCWVGNGPVRRLGCVIIGHGYVEHEPSGLRMYYGNPRRDELGEYWFDFGRMKHRMYGPKLLENIVQFLARINTMYDALRISDRGYRFVLQSHDELAWIVPEAKAEDCLAVALEEMRRAPSWARTIPLDAEGNFGDSYGDAK